MLQNEHFYTFCKQNRQLRSIQCINSFLYSMGLGLLLNKKPARGAASLIKGPPMAGFVKQYSSYVLSLLGLVAPNYP